MHPCVRPRSLGRGKGGEVPLGGWQEVRRGPWVSEPVPRCLSMSTVCGCPAPRSEPADLGEKPWALGAVTSPPP